MGMDINPYPYNISREKEKKMIHKIFSNKIKGVKNGEYNIVHLFLHDHMMRIIFPPCFKKQVINIVGNYGFYVGFRCKRPIGKKLSEYIEDQIYDGLEEIDNDGINIYIYIVEDKDEINKTRNEMRKADFERKNKDLLKECNYKYKQCKLKGPIKGDYKGLLFSKDK